MHVNTNIVDKRGSESRRIVHFCGFCGPLVYGKDLMISVKFACAPVRIFICSLVTLFSRNRLIRFLGKKGP